MSKHRRIEGETPAGGAYAEIHFLNDKREYVDEEDATMCMISEYDENGKWLQETIGFTRRGVNNEEKIHR